jgi:hypothetical protein
MGTGAATIVARSCERRMRSGGGGPQQFFSRRSVRLHAAALSWLNDSPVEWRGTRERL